MSTVNDARILLNFIKPCIVEGTGEDGSYPILETSFIKYFKYELFIDAENDDGVWFKSKGFINVKAKNTITGELALIKFSTNPKLDMTIIADIMKRYEDISSFQKVIHSEKSYIICPWNGMALSSINTQQKRSTTVALAMFLQVIKGIKIGAPLFAPLSSILLDEERESQLTLSGVMEDGYEEDLRLNGPALCNLLLLFINGCAYTGYSTKRFREVFDCKIAILLETLQEFDDVVNLPSLYETVKEIYESYERNERDPIDQQISRIYTGEYNESGIQPFKAGYNDEFIVLESQEENESIVVSTKTKAIKRISPACTMTLRTAIDIMDLSIAERLCIFRKMISQNQRFCPSNFLSSYLISNCCQPNMQVVCLFEEEKGAIPSKKRYEGKVECVNMIEGKVECVTMLKKLFYNLNVDIDYNRLKVIHAKTPDTGEFVNKIERMIEAQKRFEMGIHSVRDKNTM